MKFILATFLLLTQMTDCLSQNKRSNLKETKTDTVDVFQQFDNNVFKEKNTFWSDKNEIRTVQSQRYNAQKSDAGHTTDLTVVFYNWDSVELNKDYDLKNLKAECHLKGVFSGRDYNKPYGFIRLASRSKDQLTFYFDIKVLSTDNENYLIYKGERKFKPDY
ncbi:MAG TPA: hypothetical protein VIT44_17455 [Cyclobacteriaceae bacterium]